MLCFVTFCNRSIGKDWHGLQLKNDELEEFLVFGSFNDVYIFFFFSTFFLFPQRMKHERKQGNPLIFKTHLLKKTSSWFITQSFLTEMARRAQKMSHKTNMQWRFGSSHNLSFQIALRAQRMANKKYLPCCDCCPWSGAKLLCEMLLSGAALLPLDSIVTLHSSSAHSMTENRNFLVTGITSNALSISRRSAFASVSSRSLRKGNKQVFGQEIWKGFRKTPKGYHKLSSRSNGIT